MSVEAARFCDRCGIDIPAGTICEDCVEEWGGFVAGTPVVIRSRTGLRVNSGRRSGPRLHTAHAPTVELVGRLTASGMSAADIALNLGLSSRTVTRMRAEIRSRTTTTRRTA